MVEDAGVGVGEELEKTLTLHMEHIKMSFFSVKI